MDKKARKTFQPGYGSCFIVMLCFCLAAAIMRNYYLAGGGLAVTLVMTTLYMVARKRRNREIHAFVQEAFQTADFTSKGTDCPLPMAMIRLGDNGVVWASDRFVSVTVWRRSAACATWALPARGSVCSFHGHIAECCSIR